ncbi:MAG TPA: nucleoside triphosphate pyrophosphohydrolase [Balneolaceae bacterium]|nr:nucleoside triphosphate pyrophosphohydrolase [Balneolaceae bacterium]
MKPTSDFNDLVEIIKILRKECPWDRRQTHESLKDHIIEEAYEAVDAIERNNFTELKNELGDLMLHVIFQSRMATETKNFTIEDVIFAIQEKLIRRHPHVFGDIEVENEKQVAENWESIKMDEDRDSVLDGLPLHLPALIRAQRMQEKAGNIGFDWKKSATGRQQLWEKLQEELDEFKEVYDGKQEDKKRLTEEYGDLLFSIVNAGRFLDLQAENALRLTNKKFKRRFQYIEAKIRESGQSFDEVSLQEMEKYWQESKQYDDKDPKSTFRQ